MVERMAGIGATELLAFVATKAAPQAIAPAGNDGSTIGTGPSLSAGVRPATALLGAYSGGCSCPNAVID